MAFIIPAAGGSPEKRISSATELAQMGYTAVSPEALVAAFGEEGPMEFLQAVRALAMSTESSWDGEIKNYPGGDSVSMY